MTVKKLEKGNLSVTLTDDERATLAKALDVFAELGETVGNIRHEGSAIYFENANQCISKQYLFETFDTLECISQ